MRILIYSYNYYPEPIGIAPLMTELAEGLVRRGHQVRVLTAMPNYPQRRIYDAYKGKLYLTEIINDVVIQRSYVRIRGPYPKLIDRLLLDISFVTISLVQAFNGWKPDLIFATIPPLPICLPTALYSFFSRCPIVLNVQDIVSEAAVRVGLVQRNSLLLKIADKLENFAYQTASKICVIAEGFIDKLSTQGVSKDKIVYVPNWVDTEFIHPLSKENNSFRLKHKLENKFVVLYCGNIALTQGLQTVVKAAASLQNIPEIAFVIVGESSALDDLRRDCEDYNANNVLLLPFQSREDLPIMLGAADVSLVVQKLRVTAFNMPSKIPLILASGRAIVGSVPEMGTAIKVIQESGGGMVVEAENSEALADMIYKLYQYPELTSKLGEQGRKYAVEHYAFEKALQQYEDLFMSVVEHRNMVIKD